MDNLVVNYKVLWEKLVRFSYCVLSTIMNIHFGKIVSCKLLCFSWGHANLKLPNITCNYPFHTLCSSEVQTHGFILLLSDILSPSFLGDEGDFWTI